LLEIGTRHRILRQAFQQHLAFVEKAGRTVSALERKMLDEGLLQDGKLAVLRVAFDRADRFAVEARRRNDAGRDGVTRPVGIVDDHRAAQALRGPAAELGAGHPEIFPQEIVHGEVVAHVSRAVCAAVDGHGQSGHWSAPLSMAWVTGTDWKRWPVA